MSGMRVIVNHPTMGRTYGTAEGPADKPVNGEPATLVRADGYINVWTVPQSLISEASCARDMVIGDLLNLDMLKEAIEVEFIGSLWTEGDSGPMTPHVCECSFGDGMHLLTISTINQRPNYHVIRVDSSWKEASHWRWGDTYREDTIGDHIDEVLTAIEEECGERYYVDEECEKCDGYPCHCGDGQPWPAIEADGGCSWGHIRWPWLMKAIGITAQIETPAA
jgi:hypothetical protein